MKKMKVISKFIGILLASLIGVGLICWLNTTKFPKSYIAASGIGGIFIFIAFWFAVDTFTKIFRHKSAGGANNETQFEATKIASSLPVACEPASVRRSADTQKDDLKSRNDLIFIISLIFSLVIAGFVIFVMLVNTLIAKPIMANRSTENSSSEISTNLPTEETVENPTSVPSTNLPAMVTVDAPTPSSPLNQLVTATKTTLPSPGDWSGPTLFGSLSFTVNPQRTGITYISYTFNNYLCGNVSNSGTIGKGQKIGWDGNPITDGKFTIAGSPITITGEFDPGGTRASGTWNYPECNSSGSWVASANSPFYPQPTALNISPIKINTPKPTAITNISISAPKTYFSTIKVSTCRVPPGEKTYLCMTSEKGDWVGNGKTWVQTGEKSDFFAKYNRNMGSVSVNNNSGGDNWTLEFAPLRDEIWVAGLYNEAQRLHFRDSKHPGISISGMGRGCNTIAGKFEILELIADGSSGDVKSFAVNFEQHCDGGPALVGIIRFNSTVKP